jgi:ribosomal-protein-alanine N-acetyltransferase
MIRPMMVDQIRAVSRIHKDFFARPWQSPEIEDMLRQSGSIADVAIDGRGKIIFGFAMSRVVAQEAELLTIAVGRRSQGMGIGKALLSAHLTRLSAHGAGQVFLEVDEGNAAALRLYRAFNFLQVGRRPGYYPKKDGSRATALVLRVDLG